MSKKSKLQNSASLVEYKHLSFLIFDAPNKDNIPLYCEEFQQYHMKDIVRCCEPTYDKEILLTHGITVHVYYVWRKDFAFPDGDAPPPNVIDLWLAIVAEKLPKNSTSAVPVGVHCVAGLGRAPVLVGMALIEAGMAPLDSVIYIRERRRGAINAKQLKFLEAYKPKKAKKGCIVM